MSRDEQIQQHESVKNIERIAFSLNIRQTIMLVMIVASAVSWWFFGKEKDVESNTDLKIEMINIKNMINNQARKDSLNNIMLNNKIDNSDKQHEAHFQLIEEKMKHYKPLGVNNINTFNRIVGVIEKKDRSGRVFFTRIIN